jgi:chorismate dehydratase
VLGDLLFRRHFAPHRDGSRVRRFTEHEPNLDAMLERFDAALLIGDSALRVDAPRYCVFDLAHEWHVMTGKPFCFAFWAVRKSMATPQMAGHFGRSRDHGLEPANLDTLAREWAPRVGISERDVRSYLTENIHYALDQAVLDGLTTFFELGRQEGILPVGVNEAPLAIPTR